MLVFARCRYSLAIRRRGAPTSDSESGSYSAATKFPVTLVHLFKVISERFQSHFSEYALMILKYFFA